HGAKEQGLEPSHWEPSKAVPFALNAAVVVLAAPIVEELTFRGLGFRLLMPLGSVIAVVGTAIAFAADHGLVEGFPALLLFGLAVAFVRLRTDSLYPGMLLHACFNAFAWPQPSPDSSTMLAAVRRIGVLFVAALAFAPAAHAAPPTITATATPSSGPAPLQVTLAAAGDAVSYHWDLGDGSTADGAVVSHAYAAGRFTATVTGTSATGETAQSTVVVTATGLTLAGPGRGSYQQLARFHGRLIPAAKGIQVALYRNNHRVATARTSKNGRFVVRGRVGTPSARYTVRSGGAVSNQVALAVRPGLDTAFTGSGRLATPLFLLLRERPATAGTVTVKVWRAGELIASRAFHGKLRLRLGTRVAGEYRAQVVLAPATGYLSSKRALQQFVVAASLGPGSSGLSAYALD